MVSDKQPWSRGCRTDQEASAAPLRRLPDRAIGDRCAPECGEELFERIKLNAARTRSEMPPAGGDSPGGSAPRQSPGFPSACGGNFLREKCPTKWCQIERLERRFKALVAMWRGVWVAGRSLSSFASSFAVLFPNTHLASWRCYVGRPHADM